MYLYFYSISCTFHKVNLHELLIAEGPYATKYDFVLYPDGRSISDVDLGELGGKTTATAKYEGNTLTTYLTKKGKRGLFMTAKRTILPGN